MQLVTKALASMLFVSGLIFSDSFKFNTPNNHGIIGLINMPTARFFDESSSSLTLYNGNPDKKITLTMSPYNWFEASVFYTSINDRPYPGFEYQDYVDKGFNAKFRIKEEGYFPALAAGFNDIAGTGIYSSEYLVGSYGVGSIDFHLGIGWGRMNGGNLQFKNPLGELDKSFLNRCLLQSCSEENRQGGTFRWNDYFSGQQVGVFGGISYILNKDWLLKFEHDTTSIPIQEGFPLRDSNYNFSVEYIRPKNSVISLSYERGDYFGLKLIFKDNSLNYVSNKYKGFDKSPYKEKHNKLRGILIKNNIGVHSIKSYEQNLDLEISEYAYSSFENLKANINQAHIDAGLDIEKTLIKYKSGGLVGYSEIEKIENNKISLYETDNFSGFNYSPQIVLRPFIAGREEFLKYALLAELNMQYVFTENLFWSTNIKYALFQNFDELFIPPKDTYPNQVRSDVKDYLNNFDDRLVIGRSQLDFFKSYGTQHHLQISAGIFEEMFSGYGGEYLWRKNENNYAIGVEAFKVYKRDYDLAFGLQDYSNLTAHINFYYENEFIIPLSLKLSYGEYLAGDKGYTVDLSRRFKNGVYMGMFFTRTNVSKEQFGEGSFDKGIYFRIPLSNEWFNFTWRPLTKDPGSKLLRKDDIYSLIRKYI